MIETCGFHRSKDGPGEHQNMQNLIGQAPDQSSAFPKDMLWMVQQKIFSIIFGSRFARLIEKIFLFQSTQRRALYHVQIKSYSKNTGDHF